MRKSSFVLLTIIFLGFTFLLGGCAGITKSTATLDTPGGVGWKPPIPVVTQPQAGSISPGQQAIIEELRQMRKDFRQKAQTQPQQQPAGTMPPANLFEQKKTPVPVKKAAPTGISKHEFWRLKNRVADLEEIVWYEHPNNSIMSVRFRPGSGLLSTKEKANIKSFMEKKWYEGLADIKAVYSYASLSKPKPPLSNKQLSQLRLQEFLNFLTELGMPKAEVKKIRCENRGPTARWNYNMRVTMKILWITSPEEIKKRKEERADWKPPSIK